MAPHILAVLIFVVMFVLIVLDKIEREPAGRMKGALVETLVEEAAIVAEDLRLDQQHVADGARRDLHPCTFSRSRPSRYSP